MRVHEDELDIDEALVRALLAEQFPEWAELPLERIGPEGTVNVIYRLGVDKSVRMPRVDWAAEEEHHREHAILPLLAPQLPVTVPRVLARGRPSAVYPWTWWIFDWIEGELPNAEISATEVAAFILALRQVPADDAPDGRGADLSPRDPSVREALQRVDAPGAVELWNEALAAPSWEEPPVWIHGDLDRRNVLVRDNHLAAVLDWGGSGRGDPAVDVMAAWKLVAAEERSRFRKLLGVDDATWLRAQGWIVSQALIALGYYTEETNPALYHEARRWLAEVLPR